MPLIAATTARILTVSASMLAAVAVLILLRPILAGRKADEAGRIQARYGSVMLSVQNDPLSSATRKRVVDLISIEDLLRVAERRGQMILHLSSNDAHRYVVPDGEVVYRYSVPRGVFMFVAEKRRRVRHGA